MQIIIFITCIIWNKYLTSDCPIKIDTDNVEYELKLDNNGDCLISNGFEKFKLEGDTDYNLNIDKKILIKKKQYIEIDGFYEINEIKFPLFNPERSLLFIILLKMI